jgi:hypothetical protein
MVGGLHAGMRIGPVSFGGGGFYSKNPGPYGRMVGDPYGWQKLDINKNVFFPKDTFPDPRQYPRKWKFYNSEIVQLAGLLNAKPVKWLEFEFGYGIGMGWHDFRDWDEKWEWTKSWYAQCALTAQELITFKPEFGQFDYGPSFGFGKKTYGGMLIEVSF